MKGATTIFLFYDRITSSEIDWILRWRMFSQARQSNSKEITTYTHFLTIKQMRTRGCTYLLNQNDVFWIGQRLRYQKINSPIWFVSGDMCPQIKSTNIWVFWSKNRSKTTKNLWSQPLANSENIILVQQICGWPEAAPGLCGQWEGT